MQQSWCLDGLVHSLWNVLVPLPTELNCMHQCRVTQCFVCLCYSPIVKTAECSHLHHPFMWVSSWHSMYYTADIYIGFWITRQCAVVVARTFIVCWEGYGLEHDSSEPEACLSDKSLQELVSADIHIGIMLLLGRMLPRRRSKASALDF